MKKYLLVIVAAAAFAGYYFFSFIPFRPFVFEGSAEQEYRDVKVDSKFYKKLATVLEEYYVEHRVKDGKVFIRRATSLDKELMSTYTSEALQLEADSIGLKPASK